MYDSSEVEEFFAELCDYHEASGDKIVNQAPNALGVMVKGEMRDYSFNFFWGVETGFIACYAYVALDDLSERAKRRIHSLLNSINDAVRPMTFLLDNKQSIIIASYERFVPEDSSVSLEEITGAGDYLLEYLDEYWPSIFAMSKHDIDVSTALKRNIETPVNTLRI